MTDVTDEIARLRQIESDLHDLANARLIESYGTPGAPRGDNDAKRVAARNAVIPQVVEAIGCAMINGFKAAGDKENT